ncbi:conserved hypothetical protein [Beutenbergia cavernae DSM 12333]|uniref:Fis family transcriptional regulator n=1 Tax=Beutenbergia cavernae (strain ATCC BAA-8 / DSM 12333 / CCUG 43141 / JCM 11478 / NBRC 16432 / NCIMB 13614 / HKI 0122) TaxID=471853 RepID=C5C1P7_BEUC1|nr:hypothetical protein [Beutenbergia cavernae]ACQ79515.1 conserved hypothetical protein [Beutenbergia cavernae DSM 12333]
MRWEDLFADLDAQLAAAHEQESEDEIADLARAEAATTRFADRLRARRGRQLGLRLRDGSTVQGTVVDVAPAWVLLGEGERRVLVPTDAVVTAAPLDVVAPEAGAIESRLGLAHALRAIAGDGRRLKVTTAAGDLVGHLERVGADHVDLRLDRADLAGDVLALPFSALIAVGS